MPTEPAIIDLFNGDAAPAAPDAGFASLFFLNGRPTMRRPGQAPIDLMPRWPVTFTFFGEAIHDAIFGWHTAYEALYVTRIELEAQEAPADGTLTISLVDADGVSLARTISLINGDTHAVADIADLAVAAGGSIRAKISAAGTTGPGSWLTLRLFLTPQ